MKAFPSTAAAPLAEPPTIIDRRFSPQVWREPRDVGEEWWPATGSRSPHQDPGRNEDARKGQPW